MLFRTQNLTCLPSIHHSNPQVLTRFARKVNLVTDPPVLVEADGELIGWTPLEVEVYSQVLHLASKKIKASISL
jgi:diacylglycerol kinase family enzyme